MNTPLGIRLNNPGNIEWGSSSWQGLVPKSKSMYFKIGSKQQKRFCQFENPVMGIRAIAVTLITYYDHRKADDGSKIDTPLKIVERWAPSVENNVSAYAKQIGIALVGGTESPENTLVNMHDYEQLRIIVEAIIRHENGKGPLKTLNSWYADDVIQRALELAGVVKTTKMVSQVPVTKETVASSATGAIGVAQLAEVAPQAVTAITQHQNDLTSGNIVQIIMGVGLIGLAIFIAWSQIQKHRTGIK